MPPRADATRALLTVREVADAWGVHRQTVYKAIQAGAIPSVRVGPRGVLRVPRAAVTRLIVSTVVNTGHNQS